MNSSAIFGNMILLVAVAILIIAMIIKRESDYKKAMDKYIQDVEAYVKAVELYGVSPSAADASAVAEPVAVAPIAQAVSMPVIEAVPTETPSASGEVLLSGVDDKTAAMVIAILCEELGKSPAELRFHSITAL